MPYYMGLLWRRDAVVNLHVQQNEDVLYFILVTMVLRFTMSFHTCFRRIHPLYYSGDDSVFIRYNKLASNSKEILLITIFRIG